MVIRRRVMKLVVAAAVAGAVLVTNPWFGVTQDDSFHFELAEMRAAVEGTWQLTHTPAGEPPRTITFTLAHGGAATQRHSARALVRSAAACGHRSFVKAANACADTTDMPLEVVLLAATGPQPQAEPAMFLVAGTELVAGQLSATLGGLAITAMVSASGEARDVAIVAIRENGARSEAPATLVRTRR